MQNAFITFPKLMLCIKQVTRALRFKADSTFYFFWKVKTNKITVHAFSLLLASFLSFRTKLDVFSPSLRRLRPPRQPQKQPGPSQSIRWHSISRSSAVRLLLWTWKYASICKNCFTVCTSTTRTGNQQIRKRVEFLSALYKLISTLYLLPLHCNGQTQNICYKPIDY